MGTRKKALAIVEGQGRLLLSAGPGDPDAIVQAGCRLEAALAELPKGAGAERQAVERVLGVLQVLYGGACADPAGAMEAVGEAISAVEASLAGADGAPERLARAGEALDASGGAPAEAGDVTQPGETGAVARGDAQGGGPGQPAGGGGPGPEGQAAGDPGASAVATVPADADTELLREFAQESLEHLAAAEMALLDLEAEPDDADAVNRVFRAFHTIKGVSGFLGLELVQRVAHLAEGLLDRARDGEIRVVGGYADLALQACDALRTIIEALADASPGQAMAVPEQVDALLAALADPEAAGVSSRGAAQVLRLGDILVAQGDVDRGTVETIVREQGTTPIGQALVEKKLVKASQVAKALRTQISQSAAQATVRVTTERMDQLIEMAGELVIAQAMVAQDPEVVDGSRSLVRKISHAGKIIRSLQDLTMALRMVPLRSPFRKMVRLVRDLARKSGKQVELVLEGEDTEIDRNMVEALGDPLIHMVRNSVDHGIEPPAERAAKGKPPGGTVVLRAYHSAGNVVIEAADDGRGLDRRRILAKAVERGLVEPGREMSDGEVLALIFEPGFSTAKQITDVSGRGVGMDVVKRNIEQLRGRVDAASQPGRGTTFTIRLPLTMAIADAMVLRVGKERYLLPAASIEQSFRPPEGSVSTLTGRGEMVMLRGDVMPVFRLHRLFGVPDAKTDPYQALLIVVEANVRRCALMVDALLGQQQVVIKSLGRALSSIPGVAGGAILGDGRVGLILDAAGIVRLAGGRMAAAC